MLRTIACATVVLLVLAPAGAQTGPPSCRAIPADEPVVVDGVLDEPLWQAGEWSSGFTSASRGEDNRGAPRPVEVQTRFKVACDAEALYVGIECDEPLIDKVRADITAHDGTVWSDDCVEIFFDPAGEGRYYHHFLINSKGVWYEDYSADYGLVHGKLWDAAIQAAGHVDAQARKWRVEAKIPFGCLTLHEDAGAQWLWNVTRERHTESRYELSSWSPLKGSFHAPRLFGTLTGVDVDFRRFGLEFSQPTISVSRAGSGESTLQIVGTLGNNTGASRNLVASAAVFGGSGAPVTTGPFTVGPSAAATVRFPQLKVRTSLPTANVLFTFADADTGLVRKSLVKQVTAEYEPILVTLLRPCYRNSIYATEKLDEIAFTVKLAGDVEHRAETLSLRLKTESGEVFASKQVTLSQARETLSLPADGLPVGSHTLIVEVADAGGKAVSTCELPLRKLPPPEAGNEVRIDEHGNILVNGEPFVAIGWYGGVPTQDPREEVVALQNLTIPVVVNPPNVSAVSKPFAEHGVYSVVSVENGRLYFSFDLWKDKEKGDRIRGEMKELPGPSEMTAGYLRQLIEAVRGQPGLLGYYIADEPEIHNTRSDYLENFYRMVAELDPYHPVIVTNDTLDGIVTHGYRCADILSPDPYSSNLDYVPNFMKRCRQVLRPGQTIMLTPWHASSQAHTTADYGTAPPYTYRVMRNQALVSLAYGARGWTGYTSAFFMPEIELRYGLPAIWRELRLLQAAIGAPPPEEPLDIQADVEMAGWVRQADGHLYVVVVSHKPGDHRATIRHPLLRGVDSLPVASEGRQVAVQGGAFVDDFAEGDAHVYTTDPRGAELATTQAVEAQIARRKAEAIKPGNLLHVSHGTRATASEGYYAPWFDQYYYYAVNGITDDLGWCASHAGGKPSWIELTLPEPAAIGRIVMYSPNLGDYVLRLQGPDGAVHEATVTGNQETVIEHSFRPAVNCLKIRVTALAARELPLPVSKAPQIAEIEAYEAPGEGPATQLTSPGTEASIPVSPIPRAGAATDDALWSDDFTQFESRDKYYWDGKDTKWVFNPADFKATPKPGGGLVCTSIGEKGGSGMSHILPYDAAHRFFQVKIGAIEGAGYRFVNVGFSSSSGKPGYRGAVNTSRPGIYTVDTHYIHDSYRTGTAKSCFVRTYMGKPLFTFDWVRLVKRPVNGLAVMMASGEPLPRSLKAGDELLFHLILDEPATDATVDVLTGSSYKPLTINGEPYIQLLNMRPAQRDDADSGSAPGDGREWVAQVKLGEGTGGFDQSQSGYPVVFRARIVGGQVAETYASASVSFE